MSDTDDNDGRVRVDPSVVSAMAEATPSQQEAFDEITDAMAENKVDQTLTVQDTFDHGLILVRITPNGDPSNKGELGYHDVSVGLTKHKGVSYGTVYMGPHVDDVSLDDKSFGRVLRYIEDMI